MAVASQEDYEEEKKIMLQNRSVATVVVLSIITCGIYSLYWAYVTINALDAQGKSSNMSTTLQFVLMFLGVGYIIFALNADANLNSIKASRGIPTVDNQVVYLILGVVFPIVLIALVQNEINQLV